MTTRRAAVAGYFYPADSDELRAALALLVPTGVAKTPAAALVVPHAGYRYSGAVAGATYARVQIPSVVIVLGPNHAGRGATVAYQRGGQWETPLGGIPVDERLATYLERTGKLFRDDEESHRQEHSIEVQLPFLQFLRPDVRFVPIGLSTADPNELRDVGTAIAGAIAQYKDPVLVVASTDFSHDETEDDARAHDAQAIADIEALDSAKLLEHVFETPVTMCGFAAVCATMTAAKARGATRATLVGRATSGDVTGDRRSVVGYAGMVLS